MTKVACAVAVFVAVLHSSTAARQAAPAGVQPVAFVGTWVGTQSWAIGEPPPGSRQDQPVTLTIELVAGKLTGTMRPFLGGEDGATLIETDIVGDELRASAVVGLPRTQSGAGGRRGGPANWKDPIGIAFAFQNDGLNMTGTADVTMGDVPWLRFKYELSKKRSRY